MRNKLLSKVDARIGDYTLNILSSTYRFAGYVRYHEKLQNKAATVVREDDTKWKRLEEPHNITTKVDQVDVYQMMAYGELYDCPEVILLYPHSRELGDTPIKEKFYVKEYRANKSIHIATIDVTKSPQEYADQLQNLAKYYLSGDLLPVDY